MFSLRWAEADAETSGASAARALGSPHHGRAFAGLIAVHTVQTMFVLSGVWHEAGLLHGMGLVVNHAWGCVAPPFGRIG